MSLQKKGNVAEVVKTDRENRGLKPVEGVLHKRDGEK